MLPHLIARDPARAWTSGQWMTERTGGSDVGLSETVARQTPEGWRLHGIKWFTSAITSEVALTLARPEGNGPGGKGLALFLVHTRDAQGRPNHLRVLRLKDKLGTRSVPTAELELDGTPAILVARPSDGVRDMASMLNLTRTWNAVCSAASLRRGLALARDYARRRVAFGAPLSEKPLHLETLAALAAEQEAALQLTFHAVALLGREEAGELDEAGQAVLRLLQPVAKLLTARQAVAGASEVLEAFGGAGYVEDTGLPEILRDAQVLSIWEGTTNVLSLEAFRAVARAGALAPFAAEVRARAGAARARACSSPRGGRARRRITRSSGGRLRLARGAAASEAGARQFAFTLGRALALALLVEQAQWDLDRGRRRSHGRGRAPLRADGRRSARRRAGRRRRDRAAGPRRAPRGLSGWRFPSRSSVSARWATRSRGTWPAPDIPSRSGTARASAPSASSPSTEAARPRRRRRPPPAPGSSSPVAATTTTCARSCSGPQARSPGSPRAPSSSITRPCRPPSRASWRRRRGRAASRASTRPSRAERRAP